MMGRAPLGALASATVLAVLSARPSTESLHVLILSDRDWMHPQAGGTGTALYAIVSRWLAWGHRVTVIAGDYPGAPTFESPAPGLEIHRMGTRLTVFPLAAWAVLARRVGRHADVIMEVINGIAFFTSLWPWLRIPRVVFCQHVHQDHYVYELGQRGRVAATLLERVPLQHLYRTTPVLTISRSAQEDLVALGVPASNIHVAYLGVEKQPYERVAKATEPTLLYLGRLKQYKRIEVILDVLQRLPEARLEIAGEGDHRAALETEIRARGLQDRVTMHGYVDEQRKAQLYDRAWVSLTASSAEGWCHTVMEAAMRGTPTVALRVGGLRESIVDGETGFLADDVESLTARVAELIASPQLRARFGEVAETRAHGFHWDATASAYLAVLAEASGTDPVQLRRRLRARLITGRTA
jgi:glycosyltransferase involved in cell wall biosynthesis